MTITTEVKVLNIDGKETIQREEEEVVLLVDEVFNYKLHITLKTGELKKIPGHKLMMMVIYYSLLNDTDLHEQLHEFFENNREAILSFYDMEPVVKH